MLSELLIVVGGVIALISLAGAYYMITPLFLEVYENPSPDCQASDNCTAVFSKSYDTWFILFEMFTGGIFLAMYIKATRRDSVERIDQSFSDGDF
jgi:hypothetical protein